LVIYVSLLIVLCANMLSNASQPPDNAALKLTSYSSFEPLWAVSGAAGAVSGATLHLSGRLIKGMLDHPRLSALCAAGILIAVPPVRSAVAQASYRGGAKIGAAVVGWIFQPINSYLFGDIYDSLDAANTELKDHTGRLNMIQAGMQSLQEHVRALGGQLNMVAGDVTAVRTRTDESYAVLQDLQQQLATVRTSLDELDKASEQRSQRGTDTIRRYIDEQQQALQQQLADLKNEMMKLEGVPGKLEGLESNQQQQFAQLSATLKQIAELMRSLNQSCKAATV